ncbi:MAG TPA: trypsin-like peptidase domain-containing protein [Gemmataceae bacterium]|nr:trypsin-like peptidase domain-containing protein [Gemmataceae bacterium]
MNTRRYIALPLLILMLAAAAASTRAEESFAQISDKLNPKLVKLFGAGGFKGLQSYGTGILVSPDGYILTINSHILDTQDLRVHLADGTHYHAKVVAVEPELDVALVKIGDNKLKVEDLPYFDVLAAAKRAPVEPGTGVLAFSNQFQIATRDEPMSVQRGVIASYSKLYGRIGIFEATYKGDVYVIDAITNNPGAAGGALTTRKGELLGLIGKELRNELTNTWINYGIPINARITVTQADGKEATVSILDILEKKEKYKPLTPNKNKNEGPGVYTGIILVADPVERTPPFVEDVVPGSPADKAKLQPDDLIVYVDGLLVGDIHTYYDILSRYHPNQTVKLEIQRDRKLQTISLKLEKPKAKKTAVKK